MQADCKNKLPAYFKWTSKRLNLCWSFNLTRHHSVFFTFCLQTCFIHLNVLDSSAFVLQNMSGTAMHHGKATFRLKTHVHKKIISSWLPRPTLPDIFTFLSLLHSFQRFRPKWSLRSTAAVMTVILEPFEIQCSLFLTCLRYGDEHLSPRQGGSWEWWRLNCPLFPHRGFWSDEEEAKLLSWMKWRFWVVYTDSRVHLY